MIQLLTVTRHMEVLFEEVTGFDICSASLRLNAMQANACVRTWSCCDETVAATSKPMIKCCTVQMRHSIRNIATIC